MALIRTVAAVLCDTDGRVLLVRKHGTDTFIQPGGKREPGEDSLQTLARELAEEIGVSLRPGAARLGEFEDVAVNEPGTRVQAEVFLASFDGTPSAGAEIQELAWVDPAAPGERKIAPLSRWQILPMLANLWKPAVREVALAAGQGLEVPPGLPHQFSNPFDEPVHFLVVSQPSARGDRSDD